MADGFRAQLLAIQTTYEQRYLRSAIRLVASRLPSRRTAAEFGAGFGRLTPVLEEFFQTAIALEREKNLLDLIKRFPSDIATRHVERLSSVDLGTGALSLSFTCTVLQHMTDEDAHRTLREMRRVTAGGFCLLIESSWAGYLDGDYAPGRYFTKGRAVEEYAAAMQPWVLDFTRPRNMGNSNGPVWGHVMAFRDPAIAPAPIRPAGDWDRTELFGDGEHTPGEQLAGADPNVGKPARHTGRRRAKSMPQV